VRGVLRRHQGVCPKDGPRARDLAVESIDARPALGSGLHFLLGFGLSDAGGRDDVFLVRRVEKVVDRLRHSLALRYIKEPSVSVAQIAWLLGYDGPTSLNYAFERWTGRTASDARGGVQRSNCGPAAKLGRAP
jgi:AraC-like DNA-binding protein